MRGPSAAPGVRRVIASPASRESARANEPTSFRSPVMAAASCLPPRVDTRGATLRLAQAGAVRTTRVAIVR